MDNISVNHNKTLDLLKGIACVFVVFIHVRFPERANLVIGTLAQFAVPLFFMISGYFAYAEDGSSYKKLKRRAKRIASILSYSVAFFFAFALVLNAKNHSLEEFFNTFLNWKTWLRMCFLGDFDFLVAPHLWFLPALLYTYLILLFVERKKVYHVAYRIMIILFCGNCVLSVFDHYSTAITWHGMNNAMFAGLPWVLLGHFFAEYHKKLEKVKNSTLILYCIIGGISSVALALLNFPTCVMNIIFAGSIFALGIKNPAISFGKAIQILGNRYSLFVYIIHIPVERIIGLFLQIIDQEEERWVVWLKPIVTVVCSIIGSVILYKIFSFVKENKAGKK